MKLLKLTCPEASLKFSPLVAIEPRRRRFHNAVQVLHTYLLYVGFFLQAKIYKSTETKSTKFKDSSEFWVVLVLRWNL